MTPQFLRNERIAQLLVDRAVDVGATFVHVDPRQPRKVMRAGCDRAEITATFDVSAIPSAQRWLAGRERFHRPRPEPTAEAIFLTSEFWAME